MSLLFSEITLSQKDGVNVTLYESGHLDEYDMRELFHQRDDVEHWDNYEFQVEE